MSLSRKSSAFLSIALLTIVPNVYALIFVSGSHGHKYDLSSIIMWILIPVFAVLLFIGELSRQNKAPRTSSGRNIVFAVIYTLIILFAGAAISSMFDLIFLSPDSF